MNFKISPKNILFNQTVIFNARILKKIHPNAATHKKHGLSYFHLAQKPQNRLSALIVSIVPHHKVMPLQEQPSLLLRRKFENYYKICACTPLRFSVNSSNSS